MGIEKRRDYSYEEYVERQLEKTNNKRLRQRLKNDFHGRVDRFTKRLTPAVTKYLKDGDKILCMGARLGEEVVACNDLGLNAIGVDLAPNPPHVVEGDFNDLRKTFKKNEFDAIFTNSFDHAWDADKFFDSVRGVLKEDGIFIMDVFPGERNFHHYEVLFVAKAKDVIKAVEKTGNFEFLEVHDRLQRIITRHTEIQLIFKRIK